MATTVGSHPVSAFITPINGDPLDANIVRGNDNTLRSAYVSHDADTGIHVQSSTLSSRPVAGTAGRKWITADAGSYKLWYDDGTTWHEVAAGNIDVFIIAGESLAKGDVVKVTGYNTGTGAPTVAKVASATDVAFGIITSTTIANGATGYLTNTGLIQDVNTGSFSIGDVLYPNTSGGFTATKPTSGSYQPSAYVLRSNTNNGVLYVEFSAPRTVERSNNQASTVVLRDSNGDFAAGTITATTVNATTVDATNVEVTSVKAKDGTASIAIADSTGVATISAAPVLSALTASQAVFTNGSKALVSNAITGTGNVVMSASPTLTGTITAADLSMSGTLTLGSDVALSRGAANRLDVATGDSVNLVSGSYLIGGTSVLSGTTLGTGVTASSLTSVGTLTSLATSGNAGIGTTSPNIGSFDRALTVSSAQSGTTITALELRGYRTSGSGTGVISKVAFLNGAESPQPEEVAAVEARYTTGGAFLQFKTSASNVSYTGPYVLAGGSFIVGKTAFTTSAAGSGFSQDGRLEVVCGSTPVMQVSLVPSGNGTLISLQRSGTEEGSISLAGSTVSYNGGHLARWAQTTDNQRIALVKGTVLSNLDQMATWIDPETGEAHFNEQLNCMKVSDVEGDPNVAGVFVNWDEDDKTFTADMNVAMTGDMIIRIAEGVVVQRGDLLMSAGNGTAKPQGDDVVRSKTIAKVTSTHVTCTYEDGSYCVPCVLMAC